MSARLTLLTPSVTAIRREVLPQMTPQLAVAPHWTLLLALVRRQHNLVPCRVELLCDAVMWARMHRWRLPIARVARVI